MLEKALAYFTTFVIKIQILKIQRGLLRHKLTLNWLLKDALLNPY